MSRWRPAGDKGGMFTGQLGDLTLQILVFLARKHAFFKETLFCIRRWSGSCLEASSGRLEATPRGQGKWVHRSGFHSKKPCNFKSFVEKVFSGFEVDPGCSPDGRRPESFHVYTAPCDGPNRFIFTGWEASGRHNPF